MPKPTQLHTKGKATSMQKALKEQKSTDSTDNSSEDVVRQFELELCWCIQQLERNLSSKKGTEKELQDSWKVLQVLKNNNQPMIRKRQLMRSYFGDYRAKMQAEEKKLVKMANKMKITEKPEPKATFLRKSVFQTTGDNSFRFDFNLASDQLDNGIHTSTANNDTGDSVITCNIAISNPSPIQKDGNTVKEFGNPSPIQKDGNTVKESDADKVPDSSTKFKFTFSGSEFKFNFGDDNQIYNQ